MVFGIMHMNIRNKFTFFLDYQHKIICKPTGSGAATGVTGVTGVTVYRLDLHSVSSTQEIRTHIMFTCIHAR